MRHSSLLIAFLVTVLAACVPGASPSAAARTPSPASQALASPGASPADSPSLVASASPSPLAIPPPTVPFVRCDTVDLEMRLIKVAAAAGNIGAIIEVRNKSNRSCDLYGYAGLQLLDAAGRPLPTKVRWSRESFFLQSPAAEEVVGLPAHTPPITPDRPVSGHAYIPMSWNDVIDPCSTAAQLMVTPPDASTSLAISATPPGGSGGMVYVCSGGTVDINPTRAAEAG